MDAAQQLDEVLAQRDTLLERWMDALRRRSWALATAKAAADGGAVPLEWVRERGQAFLDALADTVHGRDMAAVAQPTGPAQAASGLEVGAPAFREPIQILSFTAGWLAGRQLPAGDALAMVHALEEALALPLRSFFEALELVVTEAYCAALQQREQARYRDCMEKAQLCCLLHPRLPCLFLVGDPDLQALDDALARLLMLAVMREAPAFIVESSGLFRPEPVMVSVVTRLGEEKRVTSHGILAGLSPELCARLSQLSGGHLSFHEELPAAVAEATAKVGISWPTSLT